MEQYKTLLTEQQKALSKDIEALIEEIRADELKLEEKKQRKALAFKEVRAIEKRLAKIG